MSKLFLVAFSLLINGCICVPIVATFYQPAHENGIYNPHTCNGVKDSVKFPFHGIFIKVALDGAMNPSFSVMYHVPKSYSIKLNSRGASIKTSALRKIEIELYAYNKESSDPTTIIEGKTDTVDRWYGADTYFQHLSLTTKKKNISLDQSGTLQLPDIFINKKLYSGPKVTYEKIESLMAACLCA